MKKSAKPNYLAKAKQLSKEETERLLSRMGNKLDRRMEKNKISQEEALAEQLELEDEQLQEWRKVMLALKAKEEAKKAEKAKSPSKAKSTARVKTTAKANTPAKAKSSAKTRVVKKAKVVRRK